MDVHLAPETFHKHIKHAKEQSRNFVYAPVVTSIIEDYKQADVWMRPRFAIEDAFGQRCIESLSNETYNKNPISRNEQCETRDWTADKLVLFGFWPDIQREMKIKNNLI